MTTRITMCEMRMAVVAMLLLPIFEWRTIFVIGSIALLIAVGIAVDVILINQLLTGIIAFLLMWLISLVALYTIQWKLTSKALPSRDIAYKFTNSGCTISSTSWCVTVQWASISRRYKCPLVWLLELKSVRTRQELSESFLSTVNQNTGTTWGTTVLPISFPVVWLRPLPLRLFLVVPTKDFDERLLDHIECSIKSNCPE